MIYIILGTTAECIKMFPVMKLFDKHSIDYKFVYTGQHGNLIEKDINRLKLRKPDIYLISKDKDIKNITIKRFLFWIPKVLFNARKLPINKNDFVIVHGDAMSTLLGLIIGKLNRVKVAHVESGKRTFNLLSPFPEEITRIIVSHLADISFPTLKSEIKNVGKKKDIYVTNGNTVFDSARMALKLKPSLEIEKFTKIKYSLFLIHRQENILIKNNLTQLLEILEMILKKRFRVIWSMHLMTEHALKEKGLWPKILDLKRKYILEIASLSNYVDFIHALNSCVFVASDAGGVQDEAYVLNKPMLVLRQASENFGIGENVYLAQLNKEKVSYFLKNYNNFKRRTKIKGSPSKVVLDFFRGLNDSKAYGQK